MLRVTALMLAAAATGCFGLDTTAEGGTAAAIDEPASPAAQPPFTARVEPCFTRYRDLLAIAEGGTLASHALSAEILGVECLDPPMMDAAQEINARHAESVATDAECQRAKANPQEDAEPPVRCRTPEKLIDAYLDRFAGEDGVCGAGVARAVAAEGASGEPALQGAHQMIMFGDCVVEAGLSATRIIAATYYGVPVAAPALTGGETMDLSTVEEIPFATTAAEALCASLASVSNASAPEAIDAAVSSCVASHDAVVRRVVGAPLELLPRWLRPAAPAPVPAN